MKIENKNITHKDLINGLIPKTGTTLREAVIYQYIQKIHRDYDDFIDGDLGERIEEHSYYKLTLIPISKIDLDEWEVDESLSEEFLEKLTSAKKYPPITVSNDYSIIDGIHRANAVSQSGEEYILAWVGDS